MLLILAEANAFNTSGAYHEFPKWGRCNQYSKSELILQNFHEMDARHLMLASQSWAPPMSPIVVFPASWCAIIIDYREAFKTSSCRRLLKQVVGQCF